VVSASTLGAYHYLTDEGAYFTNNGNMTYTTSYGRSGGAHQYYLYVSGQTAAGTGKWSSYGAQTVNADYYWYVWIPYNSGSNDAAVRYYVRNTGEFFSIICNQENHANVWVWLGTAEGTGNPSSSYTSMANYCVSGYSCNSMLQVWWDDVYYRPLN